ncbi:MAG: HAMP domain-containing histidine kinase [Proteobacteria bacterium]|nr:MAG: HAMP domain-containing histidine kinase [Pseudomonadota bacterium]
MSKKESVHFKSERSATDKNLTAEREKASGSLHEATLDAQDQNDEIVRDERLMADTKLASSRADEDVQNAKRPGETKDDQKRLKAERNRSDEAVDLEREKIDKVMTGERKESSQLIAKILDRERHATDKSLSEERDATDLDKSDSASKLDQEMIDHLKTKGSLTTRNEFLAIVSHDLRNPIGAVTLYSEMILERGLGSAYDETTEKYVRAIQRNAATSLGLVNDLMDVERITQGKLLIEKDRCDLGEIAEAALETFKPLAEQSDVALTIRSLEPDLSVQGDPRRLQQVMSNLIGNALKFTKAKGKVELTLSRTAKCVEFSVSDTGAGIPQVAQEQIFERFTQLQSANRSGLGLGLFIARSIVSLHNGRIWLESEPGLGSVFHFSIPV